MFVSESCMYVSFISELQYLKNLQRPGHSSPADDHLVQGDGGDGLLLILHDRLQNGSPHDRQFAPKGCHDQVLGMEWQDMTGQDKDGSWTVRGGGEGWLSKEGSRQLQGCRVLANANKQVGSFHLPMFDAMR